VDLTQVLGAMQMYKFAPDTATCPADPELLLYVGAGLTKTKAVLADAGALMFACNTAKLLLIVLNATRNGSPSPEPGPVPKLIFANVIVILDL
jgi:hypothetical protein